MKQYIVLWTERRRNGVCIFEQWGDDSVDMRQTTNDIKEAVEFVKKYSALFPDTHYEIKEIV